MHAQPDSQPDIRTILTMVSFDFCLVEFDPHPGGHTTGGDWVEVYCPRHDWQCGHRHRKWGPWARCATRHQQEMNDEPGN